MDELERTERLGGNKDLTRAFGAALQGPDPDRGSFEVDVPRANGQGFGSPGAGTGKRESEGLVGRPRRSSGGLEETPALIGGEVRTVAGVDGVEVADQTRQLAGRRQWASTHYGHSLLRY